MIFEHSILLYLAGRIKHFGVLIGLNFGAFSALYEYAKNVILSELPLYVIRKNLAYLKQSSTKIKNLRVKKPHVTVTLKR